VERTLAVTPAPKPLMMSRMEFRLSVSSDKFRFVALPADHQLQYLPAPAKAEASAVASPVAVVAEAAAAILRDFRKQIQPGLGGGIGGDRHALWAAAHPENRAPEPRSVNWRNWAARSSAAAPRSPSNWFLLKTLAWSFCSAFTGRLAMSTAAAESSGNPAV